LTALEVVTVKLSAATSLIAGGDLASFNRLRFGWNRVHDFALHFFHPTRAKICSSLSRLCNRALVCALLGCEHIGKRLFLASRSAKSRLISACAWTVLVSATEAGALLARRLVRRSSLSERGSPRGEGGRVDPPSLPSPKRFAQAGRRRANISFWILTSDY